MGQVNVTWVKDMQFVGTDSTNHSVVISGTKDSVGMKPSDLLMVSLASCTAYDVVSILTKKRARLMDLQVTIDGEQRADQQPAAFSKIHIHFAVSGFDIRPQDVEKAIKLSKDKYCSVSASLDKDIEVTYDFEIIEMAATAG